MFNKFLMIIGLKEVESEVLKEKIISDSSQKTIPSTENRFVSHVNSSEVTVHSTDEDVEIKALKSWKEIETIGNAIKEFNIVCMDIRDVYDKNERQRIIDFASGMVHVMNSKLRIINPDGVYLIRKPDSNLSGSERTRLESLGLYKV